MSSARRLPTSADVARAAGVSRSTVSYVLNDTPGARIPDATRERVLASAAELGYVVNRAASDLRRGSSRTVLGVLDEARAGSLASQYLPVFTEALHRAGLTLVTTVAPDDVGAPEVASWAALRPMALINFGARLSPEARAILAATGCVVIGDRDADVLMVVDQGAVAAAGVEGMRSRGRQRILQVLPQEESLAQLVLARESAFEAAAGAQGLGTVRVALRPEDAARLVKDILARPTRPDAILAHNDEYAALLVGALLDAGIDVPGQVAVLGSDNSPWGLWMRPSLSTIVLEPGPITVQLVTTLNAISQGADYSPTLKIDPRASVVHRQTT